MNETAEKSPEALTDRSIVEILRRRAATIGDLVRLTGVTATAIRQRLTRLMEQGLVDRSAMAAGRGRPSHRYALTRAGARSAGTNYDALAQVMWDEIRSIRDPEVRSGLLKRISERLADACREEVTGDAVGERMASLATLMNRRQMPFELDESGELPVLTALACPYPDLAERDRGVCAMEKMLFASVVGAPLRLSTCRLDGASCCTFEASRPAPSAAY